MAAKIGIIGYGNMGRALHQGWVQATFPADYFIVSPSQALKTEGTSRFFSDPYDERTQQALLSCDIIMLAVKPQMMKDVCKQYRDMIASDATLLSIAAGITLDQFAQFFNKTQPVIRAMPNTPSAIGKGVTGYVCNEHCTEHAETLAKSLLSVSGSVYKLDDEASIDPLSAISGSGPAYFYYIVEALAEAGIANGLDKDMAQSLAQETFIGAAALLESSDNLSPQQLRKNVTSPKGTTEAALKHLMDGDIQGKFNDGIAAAIKRAKALSK